MRWMFLLLVAASLAGCLGDDADEPEDHDDHGHDEDHMDAMDNSTLNATAPLNAAPMAMLTVNVTNLTAIFTVNVTDADGDIPTWILDVDGNGTTFEGTGNGTVEHEYSAGNFTATLSATDGLDDADVVFLNVTVVAPPPGLPGQNVEFSFPLSGLNVIGCLPDAFAGITFHPDETDGLTHYTIPIEAHTWGYSYEATMVGTPASGDQGISWMDAGGALIGGGFLSSAGTGTVPENAVEAVMWSCYYVSNSGTYISTPA